MSTRKEKGTATCPVCGMMVDMETSLFNTRHYDMTYYFCTDSCLKVFRKHPEEYVKKGDHKKGEKSNP